MGGNGGESMNILLIAISILVGALCGMILMCLVFVSGEPERLNKILKDYQIQNDNNNKEDN